MEGGLPEELADAWTGYASSGGKGGVGVGHVRGHENACAVSRLILAKTVSLLLAWGGIFVETVIWDHSLKILHKTHRGSNLEKSSMMFAD